MGKFNSKEQVAQIVPDANDGIFAVELLPQVEDLTHRLPALQVGCDREWSKLKMDYHDRLCRRAQMVLSRATKIQNHPDAEDCVQSAWSNLTRRIGALSDLNAGYLFRIVTRECFRQLRQEQRRSQERSLNMSSNHELDSQIGQWDPADNGQSSPGEILDRLNLTDRVRRTVAKLSPLDQKILAMKTTGATFAGIGRAIGRSEENVRKTDFPNAKSNFRKAWLEEGSDALGS